MVIFHSYASLPEGKTSKLPEILVNSPTKLGDLGDEVPENPSYGPSLSNMYTEVKWFEMLGSTVTEAPQMMSPDRMVEGTHFASSSCAVVKMG